MVTSIRNRIGRLEHDRGVGQRRIVVIGPGETDEVAFGRAGLRHGDDAHVIRPSFVSATAA